MASAPPPYPGPPVSGRRAYKDAVRAQREAWRAQRSYWYALRRPSLIRPFVLIAIGVIALLIQTGKISGYAFWGWYVHWWPLLLIGLGLLSLLEWSISRNSPYGARSSLGGLVGIIILLALLGFAGHQAEQSPFGWHFSPNDQNWGMHFFGKAHDRDAQFDQDFPAGGVLVVENPHGDVNIAASTDDRIHVSAHDVVYAGNDHEANRQLDQLAPHLHLTGQRGALSTNDVARGSADLTIQLPASASITVHAGHGDISVNGINGALNVDSGHGDIALNNIGSAVVAKMSEGDFSAHLIAGSLSLSGRTNDASVHRRQRRRRAQWRLLRRHQPVTSRRAPHLPLQPHHLFRRASSRRPVARLRRSAPQPGHRSVAHRHQGQEHRAGQFERRPHEHRKLRW